MLEIKLELTGWISNIELQRQGLRQNYKEIQIQKYRDRNAKTGLKK